MWDGSEWVGLAGGAGLYDFINVTFSSGVTGAIGPTISQARNSMSGQGVNLWNTNTLYYNVDSNGVQSWTVPKSGVYRITAAGAKGGEGNAVNSSRPSGNGAMMRGEFQLEEGEVYNIIAGVKPNTSGEGGGGGGGSFLGLLHLEIQLLLLVAAVVTVTFTKVTLLDQQVALETLEPAEQTQGTVNLLKVAPTVTVVLLITLTRVLVADS